MDVGVFCVGDRTHARNTLAFLASHRDLIKMVDKFAPQSDRVAVKDIINKCQSRWAQNISGHLKHKHSLFNMSISDKYAQIFHYHY